MKTLTAAAVAMLLSTSAFAQQSPGTGSTSPSATPAPSTTMQNAPAQTGSTSADANRFQTNQGKDQWLVGNLWNKNVYNTSGQSIGSLNDIVMDKDGKIAALVVGVGGFLGLGEKNVAVDFDQIKQHGSISPNRIVLGMTEQDLRNAPSFVRSSSSNGGSTSSR